MKVGGKEYFGNRTVKSKSDCRGSELQSLGFSSSLSQALHTTSFTLTRLIIMDVVVTFNRESHSEREMIYTIYLVHET